MENILRNTTKQNIKTNNGDIIEKKKNEFIEINKTMSVKLNKLLTL